MATVTHPLTLRATLRWLLGVVMFGAALPALADGLICISQEVLSFGNLFVGSSASADVSVSNCGSAPWSFTDVSIHPATGPAFHVIASCTTGMTLAPGDRCALTVTFAPLVTGQTSGGVWLHNTTNTPDPLVTFYGRGVDSRAGTATLAFVPAIAAFPAQMVGTQSAALDVELYNQGPAALTLKAIVLNGPQAYDYLGFDNACLVGSVIAAGQGCHMVLYFTPQAAGARLANLVVDSPELGSLAILQISGVGITAPPASATVVEYYDASLDHYFMTSLQAEIDALDGGQFPGWRRTGRSFKAYAQATPGANPVCRFYMPAPQDSHFYSASPEECVAVAGRFPAFVLEAADVFFIALPNTLTGACPAGTVAVYRLFNNRADANHRYTTDPALKAQLVAAGYIAEGYGPNAVIMCAPAS